MIGGPAIGDVSCSLCRSVYVLLSLVVISVEYEESVEYVESIVAVFALKSCRQKSNLEDLILSHFPSDSVAVAPLIGRRNSRGASNSCTAELPLA